MGVGTAMTMQGIGGATSAYGQYQSGLAQQSYYNYLSSNATKEAGMVREQGAEAVTMAQNEGAYKTTMLNRKVAQESGAQTAQEGANMGGGSGTAADIAGDTFDKAKMDQLAIKYNADMTSWKATNDANRQAWNLENQAKMDSIAGENAKSAGKSAAFNTLLSSAGQMAGTWYKGQNYRKVPQDEA
jgi:hypothetical protein